MITSRALGHERLKQLIDFSVGEGWEVVRTRSGHLQFTKHGLPPICTGTNALAHHSVRAAQAPLRAANRIPTPATPVHRVRIDD